VFLPYNFGLKHFLLIYIAIYEGETTYVRLYVKFPLLFSDFDKNWNTLTNFSEVPFIQFRSAVLELLTYEQTDMAKLTEALLQLFVMNASKIFGAHVSSRAEALISETETLKTLCYLKYPNS
jgi:hypothetical protein